MKNRGASGGMEPTRTRKLTVYNAQQEKKVTARAGPIWPKQAPCRKGKRQLVREEGKRNENGKRQNQKLQKIKPKEDRGKLLVNGGGGVKDPFKKLKSTLKVGKKLQQSTGQKFPERSSTPGRRSRKGEAPTSREATGNGARGTNQKNTKKATN